MTVTMKSYVLRRRLETKFERKLKERYAKVIRLRMAESKHIDHPRPYRHMGNDFFERSLR